MILDKDIRFTDNPAVSSGDSERFLAVNINVAGVVESWRDSLFSFEWLRPDGKIKSPAELTPAEREKRHSVEQAVKSGAALPMPVLGIGMMDNVEIGSGRAELLTCAALGVKVMPVHIPKSCESDFKPFLADVKSA